MFKTKHINFGGVFEWLALSYREKETGKEVLGRFKNKCIEKKSEEI